MIKKAIHLQDGDIVTDLQGKEHKITSVSNGMYLNSRCIHWKGGWACIPNQAEVIVKEKKDGHANT